MGVYNNFIILGGGGGNEIANQISVFDSSNAGDISSNILRKKVYEENTGKDVANYIDMANVGIWILISHIIKNKLLNFMIIEFKFTCSLHGSIYSNLLNWLKIG